MDERTFDICWIICVTILVTLFVIVLVTEGFEADTEPTGKIKCKWVEESEVITLKANSRHWYIDNYDSYILVNNLESFVCNRVEVKLNGNVLGNSGIENATCIIKTKTKECWIE